MQAFSGMKNKETQRQKKEARLNGQCFPLRRAPNPTDAYMTDLIELFGIRQLAASQAA